MWQSFKIGGRLKIDRSVYFYNGGIRVKKDKIIINLYGTKSFLQYEDIANAEIEAPDDSNQINLLIVTNNKDKLVFEGEKDLLEDSLFIKRYISDKIRFIENSKRDLSSSSISEYYHVKGEMQQESFVSPDDELKKSSTNKTGKLKKPLKLFGKHD